ncbi:stress response protein nst1 [Purpureocillium lavendulum]|uniref:Stress response protein nst1 n=1 Tax=Purpureocillium lavendulum TaxID=1247861 RepID=A0AB34G3D6_9HYPO|nr:stress response protein nst1 [Purpureocillium lavendulum]
MSTGSSRLWIYLGRTATDSGRAPAPEDTPGRSQIPSVESPYNVPEPSRDSLLEVAAVSGDDDSIGGRSDGSDGWVLAGDSPRPAGDDPAGPRSSTPDDRAESGHDSADVNAAAENSLRFDDANVEYLWSSASTLKWENGPFDYEIPFDRPLLHEMYDFETTYPRAAPVIRALRSLPRQAQRAGDAATSAATSTVASVQGRVVDTYNECTVGEQASQAAQYILREIGRVGESVADEARRRSQEISGTVTREWPELVGALGDGWLGMVADLAREGVAALPGLEQKYDPATSTPQ